jgi:hypothetical protein
MEPIPSKPLQPSQLSVAGSVSLAAAHREVAERGLSLSKSSARRGPVQCCALHSYDFSSLTQSRNQTEQKLMAKNLARHVNFFEQQVRCLGLSVQTIYSSSAPHSSRNRTQKEREFNPSPSEKKCRVSSKPGWPDCNPHT